jgi:PAS domain S-box-containing protein
MTMGEDRGFQSTQPQPLTAEFGIGSESGALHAHVAYFWETDQEFADAIGFLEVGLSGPDYCVIFGHDDANEAVRRILRERGFDVDALQAEGRLSVLGGSLTGEAILRTIAATFEQAVARGTPLIRLLGNIGWYRQNWPDEEDLLAFEARVTEATKQFPCIVVCMYDVRRLSGVILHHGGFETHPLIVREGALRRNPYYVPTDIFLEHLEAIAASISDRRHAEAALKTSEERFRTLFESAPIGISINNAEGRFIQVNRSFQQMLGYSEEELKRMSFREVTFAEDLSESKQAFAELVAGERTDFCLEKRYRRKDGCLMWAQTVCSAVRDASGKFVYTFAMVQDITERKKAEQGLREAMAEVERLKNRLQEENVYLQEEIRTQHNFEELVGASSAMKKVFQNVERVARTDATVLITGETGTGKELVAHAIHNLSNRKERALIKVNCAALPSGLIESELFGHEKGAFTGAIARKKGRFELADGGTIFLDEVGELPLETQAKLLRVLQEQEFERVGGAQPLKVDVRVIAATNRQLEELVKLGAFRADLFYRLNIFPIHLPALRERRDDLPLLTNYLVGKFSRRMGKKIDRVSREAMDRLTGYSWPGNVRELANVLERAVILSDGGALERDHISISEQLAMREPDVTTLDEAERAHILKTLEQTKWVVGGPTGAAKLLGLNRTTLLARMKKLGIEKPNLG